VAGGPPVGLAEMTTIEGAPPLRRWQGWNHGRIGLEHLAQPVLGINKDVAKRRVAYHWKKYEQKQDTRAASALLSAVIDLPARWIEDVWSGRR